MSERAALSQDRVVAAAAAVADRKGIVGVSMRSVATELGVEAMSLYHHVAGKEALLDALADWVFAKVELLRPGADWRTAMVARAASSRRVLSAHPWALGMLESRRQSGPALLRHHDAVLGCLLAAGFPVVLAAHAFAVLDAYIYGFVLQEVNLPFAPGEGAEEAFATQVAPPPEEYPHLGRLVAELVAGKDYAFSDEFGYGLNLILDGLEQRLDPSGAAA